VTEDGWRGVVVVTGTDTGVGKTVVTAAVAGAAGARGLRVAVVKPAQSGTADGDDDVRDVVRLGGPESAVAVMSYPLALGPVTAARMAGMPTVSLADVVRRVDELAGRHDLVLVEGAGGVLVELGHEGGASWSIVDLAVAVAARAVVVARAGLGTLNHTALTMGVLHQAGVPAALVIGAWPGEPELVHRTNLTDLGEVAGVVPDGVGSMAPQGFRDQAAGWLAPVLHGELDAAGFRKANAL
jgi:dethiobiotin synthetase